MTGPELSQILTARGWDARTFGEHVGRSRRQVDRWTSSPEPVPRLVELVARDLPRRVVRAVVDLVAPSPPH